MDLELDPKTLGEITEAVADKKVPKAAGVIAGAMVGAAAAAAGMGPAAVVPSALTKRVVEGVADRLLSDPNTDRMLSAERSFDERRIFICEISREVAAHVAQELKTDAEAVDGLAQEEEEEARFYQLLKFLSRNVVDELKVGQQKILAKLEGCPSAAFVLASEVESVPPDLNAEVELTDHLKGYLERRLGIVRPRTLAPTGDTHGSRPPTDHDSWRESLRQHEVEYEDHAEECVLRELVAAAGHGSPQKIWLIQGEPGAGKTTLVERWVQRWVAGLHDEAKDGMLLPILVRFRDLPPTELKETDEELAELLWRRAYRDQESLPHLHSVHRRARFVPAWFLDGWDEARSEWYRTDSFLNRLEGVPGAKLVTCRTAVLSNIRLPTRVDRHVRPNRLYTLRDLDPGEQLALLTRRLAEYPKQAEQLHGSLQVHRQMRALSTSPLLLGLIAKMAARKFAKGSALELPGSRSGFYRDAIDHMWREKVQGHAASDEDADLKDDVLERLAAKMGLENITIDSRSFTEVMRASPELEAKQQRERLVDFVVRSGLLVRRKPRVHEFLHLTFQEYYLARWLQRQGFRKALYQYWADPRYDETLALLVSQLVEDSDASTVEDVLTKFVEWGQKKYDSEPEYLLGTARRSPLRVTLHLVNRAGIPGGTVPELVGLLVRRAQRSNVRAHAVAIDPTTPAEVLRDLATHKDESVQCWVARNLNTPAEVLKGLATHKDESVRRWVASNSSTPAEVLEMLAKNDDALLRRDVARNPTTPAEVLKNLATDRRIEVVRWAARNPTTPAEVLKDLATHKDESVRRWVARHPNTPQEVLKGLAKDKDASVKRWVADNPTRRAAVLKGLATNGDDWPTCDVARSSTTPGEVLKNLATDPPIEVVRRAARNPTTPAEVLKDLARNGDKSIRRDVANNSNTPAEVLRNLATDDDESVRRWVARNPNLILESA